MAKTVVTPKFLEPLSSAWFEWRIGSARQGATETATDSRPFINCVRDIKSHKAWETYFKDGEKTWERFCKEVLRTESKFVDQVELGVKVLEDAGHFGPIPEKQALEKARELREGPGRPPTSYTSGFKDIADDKCDIITNNRNKANKSNKVTRGSTDPAYLTARIARDRPDIHERMKAGEYKSVRRAAIDAGIIRELTTLEKAQKLWQKMTAKERAAFQKWISK